MRIRLQLRRATRLVAIAILALVVAACGDDKAEPSGGGGGAGRGDTAIGDTAIGDDVAMTDDAVALEDAGGGAGPTWATIQPILAAHCTSCHASDLSGLDRGGAPPNVDFDTIEGALADAPFGGRAIERAVSRIEAGSMPPGGANPVPDDDLALIRAWIAAGFPE